MASNSYENKKGGSGRKLKVHFDLPEDEDYQKHSSTSSISTQDSDDIDNKDNIENFDSKYSSSGYGSPVWSFQSGSTTTTQSPSLQFMTGYDPNRIPSSVFSTRPTSPRDWSVASNESLFSLHLGNNSFSRDHAFIFNNNITKSGELSMSKTTTLPTVQEVNSNDDVEKIVELERDSLSSDSSEDEVEDFDVENEHEKTSNETSLEKQRVFVVKDDDHGKNETSAIDVETTKLDKIHGDDYSHSKPTVVFREEPKNYITSVSNRSVESDMSNHSFQFPILIADGVRTSSETVESEKQEKIVKQHQQQQQQYQQQSHKPIKPPSYENYENERTPKKGCRNWCCCCCFSCSQCF